MPKKPKVTRMRRWLNIQPTGTRKRVMDETGCSHSTLTKALHGQPLRNIGAAERISAATNGAITVADLLGGR